MEVAKQPLLVCVEGQLLGRPKWPPVHQQIYEDPIEQISPSRGLKGGEEGF